MGYLDDLFVKSKKPEKKEAQKEVKPIEEKKLPEKKEVKQEEKEAVPEDIKKGMEESLPSDKTLIDEYGVCKIYELPDHTKLYAVPVPRPTGPEREILDTIKEAATRLITVTPEEIADPEERKTFYKQRILEIIDSSPELGIPAAKIDFYAETVVREMIGYGSLDLLLQDDLLEEIMVIGPNKPVYVFHRKYGMMKTNIIFGSDDDIRAIIDRIARDVGRRIDVKDPLLDARLPDGSRVNATIPPISIEGSTITIRKFREDPLTVVDLIKYGTINSELAAFLWLAVEGMRAKPANILVSGGTGSGKTTTLNVLAAFIPKGERIITIEDTAEIKLPVEHWVRFETRPPGIEGTGEVDMDTLVKNSLRMRPDRVIVGEVRGKEASTLFTAMNTGHDGSLGTIHANNAQETLVRLKSPPMNVPELMLAALNFIIVQKRIHDRRKGTIRRVTEVAEVTGILEGTPQMVFLYEWDAATDTIRATGVPSTYLKELGKYTGASHAEIKAEIQKRKEFLDSLVEKGIRDMESVCEEIHRFVG
ncbi:MAG: CpaF family protein [Candidatus Diapherotrites archaeon]|nr:CpaF family protein [Candidatus Diapherotrites archaeon]